MELKLFEETSLKTISSKDIDISDISNVFASLHVLSLILKVALMIFNLWVERTQDEDVLTVCQIFAFGGHWKLSHEEQLLCTSRKKYGTEDLKQTQTLNMYWNSSSIILML